MPYNLRLSRQFLVRHWQSPHTWMRIPRLWEMPPRYYQLGSAKAFIPVWRGSNMRECRIWELAECWEIYEVKPASVSECYDGRSHGGLYRFYGGGVTPHFSITGPIRVKSSHHHQRVAHIHGLTGPWLWFELSGDVQRWMAVREAMWTIQAGKATISD
jgi:hypothetical protein